MKKLAFLAALIALSACAKPTQNAANADSTPLIDPTQKLVATINGEPVYEGLIKFYGAARYGSEELTEEQQTAVLNDVAQLFSLAAEAKKQGLDKDPETAMKIDIQHKSLLAQSVVQSYTTNNPITDADVQKAYDSGDAGLEYKARHILTKEQAEAVAVVEKLDAGGDFAELAKEFSTGPSGVKGGDLGWFPPSQMVKPFGDALATIKPGSYSKEPVETQFGWHVIQVEETRQMPLEQFKPQIMEKLKAEQINKYLESLKASAQIVRKP